MYICPNCKTEHQEFANFCFACGAKMEAQSEAQQPVYAQAAAQQPIYEQPVAQQPVYAAPIEQPSKAKSIIPMILSIAGLALGVIGLFSTIILFALGLSDHYSYGEVGIVVGIVFTMLSLPAGLIGMILSNKARGEGVVNVQTKLGKIFGLIAVIVSGVTLIFTFLNIYAAEEGPSYSYDYYDYYDDYDDIFDDYYDYDYDYYDYY